MADKHRVLHANCLGRFGKVQRLGGQAGLIGDWIGPAKTRTIKGDDAMGFCQLCHKRRGKIQCIARSAMDQDNRLSRALFQIVYPRAINADKSALRRKARLYPGLMPRGALLNVEGKARPKRGNQAKAKCQFCQGHRGCFDKSR